MFEVRVSSHHWEYKENNQSKPQKPRVGSKNGLALKPRDMKKSCGRLLLLSLSIQSFHPAGRCQSARSAASADRGLCKAWWGGGGKDDTEHGAYMCDGGMLGSRCQIHCMSLRLLIHVIAMGENRDKDAVHSVDKAMQELDGQG